MDLEEFGADLKDALSNELFSVGDTSVTLASLVFFVLTLLAAYTIGRIVALLLQRRLLRRFEMDEGVRYAIGRAAQYVIVAAGIIVAFQFLAVDFSQLGLIVGLLSVGIGFGLQNVTSNFISGLILLIERPVKVGDRVSVGDTEGDIRSINIRSTVVRSLANVSIIVPNQELISNNVVNWSHRDRRIRLSIHVGVSYGSDVDTVIESLREVAAEHPRVQGMPPPHVRLNEFGDSSWNMELLVWINDPKEWRDIRSEINIAIVRKFRERGVEIPFPQRDLHVRSPLPLPLSSEASSQA